MIDAPDRDEPRFPPEAEPRVASAIRQSLGEWDVGPGTLVLCQGARGTDILVGEAALTRGAQVKLMLALPPDDYKRESVELPGSGWVRRFDELARRSEVVVQTDALGPLPAGASAFGRNNDWVVDEAARTAEAEKVPLRALAVWDGRPGDGPGGTDHFVDVARERGADIRVIKPQEAWRTPNVPYWERQRPADRKKLLALDGGGLRGIITLEILARMERVLGGNDPDFVLAKYFDYIAGTSTGAIIAAALSLGRHVGEVQDLYLGLGPKIFKKRWMPAQFRSLYKDKGLSDELQRFFGADTTLGADELRTLLLVVMHRVDTDSIWPLSNNTRAKYNDRSRSDSNLSFKMWQLVRGSTAAPIYFMPERIPFSKNEDARFEDGGVTPFNNPAPLLFEMATSPRYRLGWQAGKDRMLLVSVGTGFAPAAHEKLTAWQINLLFQAKNVIKVIMNGSSTENDRLCRVLGDCRFGEPIDKEFDDPAVAKDPPVDPVFSYVRYNANISPKGLTESGLGDVDPKAVAKLDAVGAMDDLRRIGQKAAERVSPDHFAGFPL
jgi:uncharacterized protein